MWIFGSRCKLPYSERLEQLNLTILAERRIPGDLIEAFNV